VSGRSGFSVAKEQRRQASGWDGSVRAAFALTLSSATLPHHLIKKLHKTVCVGGRVR